MIARGTKLDLLVFLILVSVLKVRLVLLIARFVALIVLVQLLRHCANLHPFMLRVTLPVPRILTRHLLVSVEVIWEPVQQLVLSVG
jgi:hypothetical protein